MAQLKDTVVTGNIRVTNEVLANSIQTNAIKIPTTSGGTTYGPGTAGQVIKSDGTGAYWAADSAGVTSVTIKATSPIAIDSSAAITSTGTRTISHANSGATAGSYGDSSAQTPAYGGTFKVPYLSVNATGHVTSISEHTVKIPASDNTDTKVTSATNHYAPAEDSTAQLSADASGGAAATWNSTQLVTGVDIKRDAKGHVTGVAVDSIKMPANPNTNTTYTLSSGTNDGTLKLTPSSGTAQDNIKVTGWDDLKSLATNATHFKSGFAATGDGAIDGGSTTLKSVAEKIGDMYVCTTAGTLYGTTFEVGDSIIFKADVAAGTAPTAASIIAVESTVSVTQTLTSGTKIGTVEGVDLYCQTNTDTKVTVTKTNPTTQTSYYPTWYSSAAGGTGGVGINDGFVYNTKEGTTSADGIGQIFLGNGVASGTAGNKKGYLRIYNKSTGYALLSYADGSTSQVQQTFPATAGTVLNTGTTSFTQTLTSGTEIGKLKINNVETTLYAQDDTKLPLAGGTMSGDITMNGNAIYFGSSTSGVFAQYSDNILDIGNQSGRILFSDSDIQITTPGPQDFIFKPGANGANFQIKSDLKVSGNVCANKIFGYSSGSPSVEIRATSGATPYIKIDTSSITLSAPTWSTGSGTAAYITGTTGANKLVKYSSSRRYKDNIDYEIDKEKYHEDLLKFKPCRFNYKTEPGLTNLGLIAEDVEEINPELCNFEGDKVESFKDRDLLVMCILELQRKDKEINELKSRLESLETRYNVEF